MRLIVGLGNPGSEYEWSRHNLGFLVVDKLANQLHVDVSTRECSALVARTSFEDREIKLVKPQTYMNLSGESVRCLLVRHQLAIPGEDLIVVSDDLALPFGRMRIRVRGSAGGHNGLKSIIAATGTDEFVRLRIGIHPEHPVDSAKAYVLETFPRASRDAVEEILDRCSIALRVILKDGALTAMSEFN